MKGTKTVYSNRSSSTNSSRRSSIRDSLSSLECGEPASVTTGGNKRKRMRSGFRTDRTDTEMEEPLPVVNNKIYFSTSSLNENQDDARDGLLINEFPNASRIGESSDGISGPDMRFSDIRILVADIRIGFGYFGYIKIKIFNPNSFLFLKIPLFIAFLC